jgi:hypothetical protein
LLFKGKAGKIGKWGSLKQKQPALKTVDLRAAQPVLSMWPCKIKLDEEKAKHAGLAQQNGFGPAFLHRMLRLV